MEFTQVCIVVNTNLTVALHLDTRAKNANCLADQMVVACTMPTGVTATGQQRQVCKLALTATFPFGPVWPEVAADFFCTDHTSNAVHTNIFQDARLLLTVAVALQQKFAESSGG